LFGVSGWSTCGLCSIAIVQPGELRVNRESPVLWCCASSWFEAAHQTVTFGNGFA
jgi:hypothetical protein